MITGSTFVPPAGDPLAPIVLVGEQPGRIEVKNRQPFVGPSGRVLFECLGLISLVRHDCYITNVIKDLDKHLEEHFKYDKGKVTVSDSWYKYLEILEKELSQTEGLIIAIGNVALYALTGNIGITKWRGSVLESTLLPGRKVIPIIHPATIIPPKNQYLNKILIQFDLKRAKDYIDGRFQSSDYEILIRPSFLEAVAHLEECLELGLKGFTIDYDIELRYYSVSCIAFAHNPVQAMSIPFIDEHGDYFRPEDEVEIWRLIAQILSNPNIRKRGQNLVFDSHFLLSTMGIATHNMDDTMIAQKTLMSEMPMGLDFITSIWTGHPYYKDEGKKYFSGGNYPRLWTYNGTDACVCAESFPKQYSELRRQGNLETYLRQAMLIEPLVFMMERGIRADIEGINKKAKELDDEIQNLTRQLHAMVGWELNVDAPQQLQRFFYGIQGYQPYKSKTTHKVSADADALKRLVRKGSKEAALVSKIKKKSKVRSVYMEPNKFDTDGRYRSYYNPGGTRYSRLSSSENIFGKGGNAQNWPHDCLQYLLADEGYIYCAFDLAQAENRLVAYLGKVTEMIEAFEQGKDVHSLTAGLIFNKDPNEISDVDGSSTLGSGEYSERFWGKKANHGLNYDLSYKVFALYYELPETQAKFIVERYHKAYPGVREGFHAYVKKCLRQSRMLINPLGRRTLFLDAMNDQTFKDAYACIPQGTVGDIINERGIEYIYYNQNLFSDIELLQQVHDSIGFQIPIEAGWLAIAEQLFLIKHSLEQPIRIHDYDVVIPADLNFGLSLYKESGKEVKHKKFPKAANELADILERGYNDLVSKGANQCSNEPSLIG